MLPNNNNSSRRKNNGKTFVSSFDRLKSNRMRYAVILSIIIVLASVSCKNRHRIREAEKQMETLSSENSDSTAVNEAFADLEGDFIFDEDSVQTADGPSTLFCNIESRRLFWKMPNL